MTLHHAGGALDNIAKRLNKLLIFMIAVSEDWESWSPEEREPLLLNIAARLDGWCCHADTAKGTRCQNSTTWPYDRCYAHLTDSDKVRHDAEQQKDDAERTRLGYWKELGKDEQEGRADDLARQKEQREATREWLVREEQPEDDLPPQEDEPEWSPGDALPDGVLPGDVE